MKKVFLFVMVLVLTFCMSILSFAEGAIVTINDPANTTPVDLITGILGQTFTTTADFNQIEISAPTWGPKPNSIFTFTIRKDSPIGKGLYMVDLTQVADNSTKINLPTIIAGVYYIEMSKGDADPVGWWSTTSDIYAGGTAFLDGEPEPDIDRCIVVSFVEGLEQTAGLKPIVEDTATQSAAPTQSAAITSTNASTQAAIVTNAPLKTQAQVALPSPTSTNNETSSTSKWVIGGIITVAVVGAGVATYILLKKKTRV